MEVFGTVSPLSIMKPLSTLEWLDTFKFLSQVCDGLLVCGILDLCDGTWRPGHDREGEGNLVIMPEIIIPEFLPVHDIANGHEQSLVLDLGEDIVKPDDKTEAVELPTSQRPFITGSHFACCLPEVEREANGNRLFESDVPDLDVTAYSRLL